MGDEKKDSVNPAGVTASNNPMGARRQWIKLWVDPWLDGTTRYVNTGSERAFWVDLLAEAGRSRFPGYVCPGQEHGELLGYPVAWYQSKQSDLDVMATFEKFASQGKIAYTITSRNPTSVVVQILNWDKYQAPIDPASRSRDYRNRKKKELVSDGDAQRHGKASRGVTTSDTEKRHDAIEEGEGEVEKKQKRGREEGEEESSPNGSPAPPPSAAIQIAFDVIGQKPTGSLRFQHAWCETYEKHKALIHNPDDLPDIMEECLQLCQRKGIKPPPPFIDWKRMAEFDHQSAIHNRIHNRLTSTSTPEPNSQPSQVAQWANEGIEWSIRTGRPADEYIKAKRDGREP